MLMRVGSRHFIPAPGSGVLLLIENIFRNEAPCTNCTPAKIGIPEIQRFSLEPETPGKFEIIKHDQNALKRLKIAYQRYKEEELLNNTTRYIRSEKKKRNHRPVRRLLQRGVRILRKF